MGLTRSITQTDMSVIYFCFLYILDICLLTVNVFAPQFNVYYNCELSPIPNEWNCRLINAIFKKLLIFRVYLIQLLVYLFCFITIFFYLVDLATYFTFLTYCYVMTQHNQFLDGVFWEATSLTHLLDTIDKEHDNEAQIIKQRLTTARQNFLNCLVRKLVYPF